MEPIQAQMVFCGAEQWMNGFFCRVEPWEDGLRLDPKRAATGVYCLGAVDSGEKGFRWGRAAVEADLPPDTALRVYARAADTLRWGDWPDLDQGLRTLTGDPLPALEEIFGPPVCEGTECLLSCTGRYLWIMLELTATGLQAPVIRKLRLWMRGDHMTDYLPAIYQGDDFTWRFLSIFDSMYADMDRAIDALPGQMDYCHAQGALLRYLASWVCVERGGDPAELRRRISTALPDYEDLYTVEGVKRSVRRLTGRDPIVIEPFQVSPNRPDCADPVLYRRLYGEDPYRFFVLLPEDAFAGQREREQFQRDMEEVIPAGMTMQMIQLKPCVQLDWHTYLGINARIGGYVPAVIDEQATIHYDTTIGGANHD